MDNNGGAFLHDIEWHSVICPSLYRFCLQIDPKPNLSEEVTIVSSGASGHEDGSKFQESNAELRYMTDLERIAAPKQAVIKKVKLFLEIVNRKRSHSFAQKRPETIGPSK